VPFDSPMAPRPHSEQPESQQTRARRQGSGSVLTAVTRMNYHAQAPKRRAIAR